MTARAWRSRARPTRTTPCRRARRRCSAPTCGSTRTTSSTRPAVRTTWTRSGTWSTGARSPSSTARSPSAPPQLASGRGVGMLSMMETSLRRAGRALVLVAAGVLLSAAPAHASSTQLSVIEDEHQMLELGPAVQASALDDAVALGADVVRANVIWARYAPSPDSKKKPKGFDAKNPASYPGLATVDGLVTGAQARGLQVLLTVTGPIPAWASKCGGSGKSRHTGKPDPTQFGQFVRAVGKRYPTVKLWSIWNEPNLRPWLTPQYAGSTLEGAVIYRNLARSAIARLRGNGPPGDQILPAETAR